MTEDDQLLYDEMVGLRELAAEFNRNADNYEQNAKEARGIANGYTQRADAIAEQLNLV